MNSFFNNPNWIENILKLSAIDEDKLIDDINQRMSQFDGIKPKVSIIIPAKNEEQNILKCIYSLSHNDTNIPFEIIVVDNGSTDRTAELVTKTKATIISQMVKSIGLSREVGQVSAKGDYILQTDADCLYPKTWIQYMYDLLSGKKYICVYGRYRFIGDQNILRWKLSLYELAKFVLSELRQVNRPFLNAYGMNMGYPRDIGVKIGFDTRPIRGTDGRLVYEFSKIGKLGYVRGKKLTVWAENRALLRKGSFLNNIVQRLVREIKTFKKYLHKIPEHDSKKSSGTSV